MVRYSGERRVQLLMVAGEEPYTRVAGAVLWCNASLQSASAGGMPLVFCQHGLLGRSCIHVAWGWAGAHGGGMQWWFGG